MGGQNTFSFPQETCKYPARQVYLSTQVFTQVNIMKVFHECLYPQCLLTQTITKITQSCSAISINQVYPKAYKVQITTVRFANQCYLSTKIPLIPSMNKRLINHLAVDIGTYTYARFQTHFTLSCGTQMEPIISNPRTEPSTLINLQKTFIVNKSGLEINKIQPKASSNDLYYTNTVTPLHP